MLGAIFLCIAILFYINGKSFNLLVLGQIFFAGHMSFISGTNTVFHYESLKNINKHLEYGEREASVNKWALFSGGLAALLGGLVADFELHYAYWLSLVGAVIALIITFLFDEPKNQTKSEASDHFLTQLKLTIGNLKNNNIAWIFAFYILMFVMVHVPYEFYQPYLDLLEKKGQLNFSSAPMMSGFLYASAMFISSFAAARSMKWKNYFGLKYYLILMLILMFVIVGMMAFMLHPAFITIILMRSFSWSGVKAPINEVITPNISAGQRATFHSMMSLVCRLSFFLLLFGLSALTPTEEVTNWNNLSMILKVCLGVGLILAIPIILLMRSVDFENRP
jgi:MFS family permease